jgi:guanylate kinase
MERAKEEAQGMDQYDYVLINDDLETCVKQMHETIQSQHFMSSNQKDFIEQMKKSLEK